MSICKTTRFVINKNQNNEFVFTIKKIGSVDAMEIKAGDTFVARIYKLDTGAQYGVDISTVANSEGNQIMAPIGLEGKITLKLANAYCTSMESAKGSAADRYYLKPGYRLAIECNTDVNGKFTAKVPLVYVE